MDFPNWVNTIELVIALILVFNWIGNFPPILITILGVILLVDVLIDIIGG